MPIAEEFTKSLLWISNKIDKKHTGKGTYTFLENIHY
jgi:hypothetical protein